MALAIDASTPAYASTAATNTNVTSPSFTPPVGALLVVVFANGGGADLPTQPVNTGGTVTWNAGAAVSESANSCSAAVWLGTVTASASMTVKCTLAGGANDPGWGFGVVVVTGQASTQNGATGVSTSTSGTPSKGITTVGANSLVLGGVANFSNQTVGTAGTGQSLTFNGHAFSLSDVSSGAACWAQYLTGMNLAAGATATINDTAPTGIDYSMAVAEILAASGAVNATVTATAAVSRGRVQPPTQSASATPQATVATSRGRSGTPSIQIDATVTATGATARSRTGTPNVSIINNATITATAGTSRGRSGVASVSIINNATVTATPATARGRTGVANVSIINNATVTATSATSRARTGSPIAGAVTSQTVTATSATSRSRVGTASSTIDAAVTAIAATSRGRSGTASIQVDATANATAGTSRGRTGTASAGAASSVTAQAVPAMARGRSGAASVTVDASVVATAGTSRGRCGTASVTIVSNPTVAAVAGTSRGRSGSPLAQTFASGGALDRALIGVGQ